MSRNRSVLAPLVIAVFAGVLAMGATAAPAIADDTASADTSGGWTATLEPDGVYHMKFTHRRNGAGRSSYRWSMSRDWSPSEFTSFSDDGDVITFTRAAAAGVIAGSGSVRRARASGDWSFAPDPAYPAALEALGYDRPRPESLVQHALAGVTLETAESLAAMDFEVLKSGELVGFVSVGGTPERAAAFADMGVDVATMGDLIALTVHGLDAERVAAYQAAGLDTPAPTLIALGVHNVSPDFIAEVRAAGFDANASDLIAMRVHGVSTADAIAARDHHPTISVGELVAFSVHGITAERIEAYAAVGVYASPGEMIALAVHGMTPARIERLKEKGVTDLSAGALIERAVHGG